jgi:uncharacterized membrane protein
VNNDPRDEDFRLIIEMIIFYLSWFIGLIIITIPKSSHSSRFWSSIYLILVIVIRTVLTFTEIVITNLPFKISPTLTEFELIYCLHIGIPVVFLVFRLISEWSYVDVESETIKYLATISQNHQVSSSFTLLFAHILAASLTFSNSS